MSVPKILRGINPNAVKFKFVPAFEPFTLEADGDTDIARMMAKLSPASHSENYNAYYLLSGERAYISDETLVRMRHIEIREITAEQAGK